jgi:hypothetical protein
MDEVNEHLAKEGVHVSIVASIRPDGRPDRRATFGRIVERFGERFGIWVAPEWS